MARFRKLLVANWKANPAALGRAKRLAAASDQSGVVVAPPFIFLPVVAHQLKKAALGAQDVFGKTGPFTGAIAAEQLKKIGVRYVIVGHSERRQNFGETDQIVNRKLKAVLKEGLRAILCVGEPWIVKKGGLAAARDFVKKQLKKDLAGLPKDRSVMKDVLIAYEPVWAISPGRPCRTEDVELMSGFIRGFFRSELKMPDPKILYGGSVNSRNAASFLALPGVSGLLVGAASLRPAEFQKIISCFEK